MRVRVRARECVYAWLLSRTPRVATMGSLWPGLQEPHAKLLTQETYCNTYPCAMLFSVLIAEPVTTLTDLALSAELLAIAIWLWTRHRVPMWPVAFFMLSICFALAAIAHGLGVLLLCEDRARCRAHSEVWVATLLLQVAALALFATCASGMGCAVDSTRGCTAWRARQRWAVRAYATFVVTSYSTVVILAAAGRVPSPAFVLSFSFALPSMVVSGGIVFLCFGYSFLVTGSPGTGRSFLGWLLCSLSLVWQAFGVDLHPNFNRSDAFHVMYMVGIAVTAAGLDLQLRPIEAAVAAAGLVSRKDQ